MKLVLELVPLVLLLLALAVGVLIVRRVSSGKGVGGVAALLGAKKRSEAGKMDSAIRLAKLFEEAEALKAAAGMGDPPLHPLAPGAVNESTSSVQRAEPSAREPSPGAEPSADDVEGVGAPAPQPPDAGINGERPAQRSEDRPE